jgi:SAM-dependent methyltransferase
MTQALGHVARPPLVERLLAPGADDVLLATLRGWIARGPRPRSLLDVGVGSRSLLRVAGFEPIGVDLSPRRARAYHRDGGRGIVGTAVMLPFANATFDLVVSCGLLHHLSDNDAHATLAEMPRVTRPGGRIAVFDSVLPEPAWRRPLAWAVRRADRGRFVRRGDDLQALLPEPTRWQCTRLTYTATGLEGLWCTRS